MKTQDLNKVAQDETRRLEQQGWMRAMEQASPERRRAEAQRLLDDLELRILRLKRQQLERAKARLKAKLRLGVKSCTELEVEYEIYQASVGPRGGFRKIES